MRAKKMTTAALLRGIASVLSHINYDDMTTAERKIADLLEQAGIEHWVHMPQPSQPLDKDPALGYVVPLPSRVYHPKE